MSKRIITGRAYVKRSALTGKARRVTAVRELGEHIVCIADDNGRTLIVSRQRLHRESVVATDQTTFTPSDELQATLDGLLAQLGKGDK